jgi:hypothetical protein
LPGFLRLEDEFGGFSFEARYRLDAGCQIHGTKFSTKFGTEASASYFYLKAKLAAEQQLALWVAGLWIAVGVVVLSPGPDWEQELVSRLAWLNLLWLQPFSAAFAVAASSAAAPRT